MSARFSKRYLLFSLLIIVLAGVSRPATALFSISRDFIDHPIPSQSSQTSGKMDDVVIDITEHFLIHDLDIAVTLTHSAFFDLNIKLQSPWGAVVTLNPSSNYAFFVKGADGRIEAVGGTNRFLFDDEAHTAIEEAIDPWDQPFKPADGFSLSNFDRMDAFGQWRLQISDDWPLNAGHLHKVELLFDTPEPTTISLFVLACMLARLSRHRK